MLKNSFILLLFLLVSFSLVSQTLYTPNIPTTGVSYNVSVKSDTTMFSQQGPWDFSSTTTTSNEDDESYNSNKRSCYFNQCS